MHAASVWLHGMDPLVLFSPFEPCWANCDWSQSLDWLSWLSLSLIVSVPSSFIYLN